MTLRVVTPGGNGGDDWEIDGDPGRITLRDLAQAVGLPSPTDCLLVDGRPAPVGTTLADAAVVPGTRLEVHARSTASSVTPVPVEPADWLRQVAGLGAGSSVSLPPGAYAIGSALAGTAGLRPALVDTPLAIVDALGTDPSTDRWVELPGAVFRLTAEPPTARRAPPADGRGLVVVHRPPRTPSSHAAEPPRMPPVPPAPRPPGPLSWVTVLGPLPVVATMSLLFSARLALLGLAGPVLALGRWAEGRHRHRRETRRHTEAVTATQTAHVALLRQAADLERNRRWTMAPDPATLHRAVTAVTAPLWERRAPGDALALCVGATTTSWPEDARDERVPLAPAPVLVALADRHAIGVVGSVSASSAAARWLVAQASALYGPADLALAALLDDVETIDEWAWLKWLPHLGDRTGSRRVATTPDDAAALMVSMVDEPGQPTDRHGLLVATVGLARTRAVREQLAPDGSRLRAIVLGRTVDELPAWCDVVLEVADDGTGRVTDAGSVIGASAVTGVDQAWTATFARAMARLDDPERPATDAGLPSHVALASALGLDPHLDDIAGMAGALVRRWQSSRTLAVPVGADEAGPFVLDLVADGPHALVAGTTGAGKSELLRSWVTALAASASPDDVNLILVDFKGGGAFDACAEFPHTVAVVTDLDDRLAARALRCLRAEVRHRETLLRDAGATDIAQYCAAASTPPLPRLVVVVDEFATLAAELPEFVSSIVDVAQRGRSLGIHLVLATQRPSGVVDHKVRANTNVRVALRVQDDADSFDVIGTVDAARVSRRTPGRAFARLGAGEVHRFQAAIVSAATRPPDDDAVTVRPFTLSVGDLRPVDDRHAADTPTDLTRLAAAARLAARQGGYRPPRVPWPAPLPAHLDAIDLWATAGPVPWTAAIGLADEPDQQRQTPWRWRAAEGNLLVLGANGLDTSRVLTTIALGLADTHHADEAHIYVVDGGSGALAPLTDLPHCGAYASGGDTARTARVLELLADELERRRRLLRAHRVAGIGPETRIDGDPLPLVLLLIDNAGAILEALDADAERDALAHLAAIVRDGPTVGVVTALGAPHERALPGRLAGLVPHRLVLRLADVTSYLALGLAPRQMPALGGLRGMTAPDGIEVQIAEVTDVAAVVRSLAASTSPPTRPPRPVRTLGSRVELHDVDPATGRIDDAAWSLPIGVDASYRPVALELPSGIHALVSGAPGSGRSTTLVTIALAARAARPGDLRLSVIAPRRSPLGAIGAVVTDVAGLDAAVRAVGGGPHLILVDDSELVPPPLAQALGRLAETPDDGRRLVVAGRADGLRSATSWTASLRQGRSGVALQPAAGDGDVFRTALPLRLGLPASPGRGYVISLGTARLAQIGVSQPPT